MQNRELLNMAYGYSPWLTHHLLFGESPLDQTNAKKSTNEIRAMAFTAMQQITKANSQ